MPCPLTPSERTGPKLSPGQACPPENSLGLLWGVVIRGSKVTRFAFWKLRARDKLETGRCRDKLGAASNCPNPLKWNRILDSAPPQAFWRAVLRGDWLAPDYCQPPDLRGMLKETDICGKL